MTQLYWQFTKAPLLILLMMAASTLTWRSLLTMSIEQKCWLFSPKSRHGSLKFEVPLSAKQCVRFPNLVPCVCMFDWDLNERDRERRRARIYSPSSLIVWWALVIYRCVCFQLSLGSGCLDLQPSKCFFIQSEKCQASFF